MNPKASLISPFAALGANLWSTLAGDIVPIADSQPEPVALTLQRSREACEVPGDDGSAPGMRLKEIGGALRVLGDLCVFDAVEGDQPSVGFGLHCAPHSDRPTGEHSATKAMTLSTTGAPTSP